MYTTRCHNFQAKITERLPLSDHFSPFDYTTPHHCSIIISSKKGMASNSNQYSEEDFEDILFGYRKEHDLKKGMYALQADVNIT